MRVVHETMKDGPFGKIWYLLKEYLSFCVSCVSENSELSGFAPVMSEAPQGNILGPLLFILYTKDQPLAVSSLKILFVDDTNILKLVITPADVGNLQLMLVIFS